MARWTFGDCVLDLDAHELLRGGTVVSLSPKGFQLLRILVDSQPKALSRTELLDRLWPGTFVVEKNLTNLVSEIRAAIGDDPAHPRHVRTVHRFGYAFRDAVVEQAGGSTRHNLPLQLTTFVGRSAELVELERLMAATRLLTLTGAGGCGKTRLAIELAWRVVDRFPDGVWWVDLAPLSDPHLVGQTVASVLDVREGPNRQLREALSDYLRTRRLLIVLDNCEHVIAGCAPFALEHLGAAASLSILATSREGLGINGEAMWRVPSLSLPDDRSHEPFQTRSVDDTLAHDAVKLFVDRGRAADPEFALTDGNALLVGEVCRRLDGIPLAIELAAARLRMLSIDQIGARLSDRFRLLTGGGRTAVARQRTLEAAVDWSYDLLSDAERRLLRRLSVFAGGWTIESAETVTVDAESEQTEVLNLLSRLIDKSLVNVESDGRDRRYRFLETVRHYARERLLHAGEAERLRDNHLQFYQRLAARAEPELLGSEQVAWLNRLDAEHDNLRSALDWSSSSPERADRSVGLAASLTWFWIKRGRFREGQEFLERALAADDRAAPALRAKAVMSVGMLMFFQGHFVRARQLARQTAAFGRSAGDLFILGFSLGLCALASLELGDLEECAAMAREGQTASRASAHPWVEGLSLSCLGYLALQGGDLDRAAQLQQDAVDLCRRQGDTWGIGISLFDLALLRVVQGQYAQATALCAEGISLYREFNDRRGIAWCLGILSSVEAAHGHLLRAARLRGAMEGLLESVGAPVQASYHTLIGDRYLTVMKHGLGERAYDAAWTEGRCLSLAQAIALGHEAPRLNA